MVPKRVKTAKPIAAKRSKATIYRDPESESEVDTRSVKSSKKRAANPVNYNDPSEDELDDEETFTYKTTVKKQPQPRPKKKISSNTTTAPPVVAAPPTSTTAAFEGSSNKQKAKAALADIANALQISTSYKHNNNSNNSNSNSNSKSSSMLKARKDTSFENQENIDTRRSKDDGGKHAKKTMRQSSSAMSHEQLAAALDELKDKHRRLQQLRETDAERNLTECRAQLDETIRSAANYRAKIEPQLESALRVNEKLRENNEIANAKVRTLQRQVRDHEDALKQRDQEDKIKAKTASMESVLASPDVTPNTASAISTIKMYENLSGFKLVPRDIFPRSNKEKIPAVWDCEHSGPRGTLRFTLTYNYSTSMVAYVPKIDRKRDEKLLKNLPDYLTDEIEFEREFESKFFWRILNFNNDDDA
ncbi:hypothetical protein BGZ96_005756 [Linnemannia gamsii]|uniref:Monopolin complex subunit Csm1/Pcs1 C-terminal domain-containing protein n=1 Tax=Linnemannia gamsii TaxID=64522 RepID=A0ABQ7K3K7_9FUNG|nr:hypothetical protein BGZ96_005756 [Linnemannia gamsii]